MSKPKHHRGSMTREERIAAAPKMHLMKSSDVIYQIRRYASWFYVSPDTAIEELRLAEVTITAADVAAFKKHADEIRSEKRCHRNKKKPSAIAESDMIDDTFAYIAGYTAMGFPYGTTWDELSNVDKKLEM